MNRKESYIFVACKIFKSENERGARGDKRPRLIFLSENVDNNNLLAKIKLLYTEHPNGYFVETIKLSLKDMAPLEISKRVKDKDIQKLYEVIPILALEVEKF